MCPCELCPSVFKPRLELLGLEIIKTKFLQKIFLWELWDNHHQKIASVALMFLFVFTRFASLLSICIGFAFIRSSRPLWLYYRSSFGRQEVWSQSILTTSISHQCISHLIWWFTFTILSGRWQSFLAKVCLKNTFPHLWGKHPGVRVSRGLLLACNTH